MKRLLLTLLRWLPIGLCFFLMGWWLWGNTTITAEGLLQVAPAHPFVAAMFLMLLYAVKSLTLVFPIVIVNVLGGFLFPPLPALLLNSVGTLVELMIPYWVGRVSGANFTDRLCRKHPRIDTLASQTAATPLFSSFFLRLISCLPGDGVSLYFGAIRMPFGVYLWGSFLGTVPGVIPATLLGMSIADPTSPLFWLSLGLTAVLSAVSFWVYWRWQKRKSG